MIRGCEAGSNDLECHFMLPPYTWITLRIFCRQLLENLNYLSYHCTETFRYIIHRIRLLSQLIMTDQVFHFEKLAIECCHVIYSGVRYIVIGIDP